MSEANKTSILFVIPTMRMGGAERALVSLLKSLDYERLDVSLLLFEVGGVLQTEIPWQVHVIEADAITRAMILEFRFYGKDLLRAGKIAAYVARLRMTLQAKRGKDHFSWDVLKGYIPELHGSYDVAVGFLEGATDFYVLDKVRAARKIGWIHTDMAGKRRNASSAELYEHFDYIATIAKNAKKSFTEIYPECANKIEVIENIVLSEEVREKAESFHVEDWERNRTHIVSVGSLTEAKGIDVAARACKELLDAGRAVVWHVYGEGVMRGQIEDYVRANRLEDVFILEGLAENPYPYMAAADIIVQPSRWEGKSIALDEAKILGKPIVVTDYSSVSDQIENGVTGLVVGMEPKEIAEGVMQLMDDADLRVRIGRNCAVLPDSRTDVLDKFYGIIGL